MPEEKDRQNGKLDADAFERELTTDLDAETPDKPKGLALHTRILIGLAVGVIAGVAVNWISAANIRASFGSSITSPIRSASFFCGCC